MNRAHHFIKALAAFFLALGVAQASFATVPLGRPGNSDGSRAALVIGNASYPGAPLKNPLADAEGMAKELEELGFHVTLVRNAPWKSMQESVREFTRRAETAKVRVVFYAGHGAQIKGRNYMVPVDVDILEEEDLTRKSVDLGELVERLGRQTQAVNVVIVDACRNNPATNVTLAADGRRLKSRGAGAIGLARMPAPAGTLIAYSTAPGQVADDRLGGKNSLYTKHLLSHIDTPGITLEQLFKRVRLSVLQESQNKQQPWEENSLSVDYCLKTSAGGRCPGI
ncbi:MAG: hypothetical protein RL341_1775 [Pseudomonadota bacterium]|jgi:uncharacterized caspase-like protein